MEFGDPLVQKFACMDALLLQSSPTLCEPMDYTPPGSSVHGVFQPEILEWVAISLCRHLNTSNNNSVKLVLFYR